MKNFSIAAIALLTCAPQLSTAATDDHTTVTAKEYVDMLISSAEASSAKFDFITTRIEAEKALKWLDLADIDKREYRKKKIYILYILASAEAMQGNIDGCRKHADEALLAINTLKRNDKQQYAESLQLIFSVYLSLGDQEKAGKTIKEALTIYAGIGSDSEEYANALWRYATYMQKYTSSYMAINYCRKAMAMFERTGSTDSYSYAMTYATLASCHADERNYAEAVKCQQHVVDYIRSLDFTGDSYLYYLQRLLELKYYAGDYSGMIADLEQITPKMIADVKTSFLYLNSYEKENYANGISNFLNFTLVKYTATLNDRRLWGTVYDALLFAKGLLLNSEMAIEKVIGESGNVQWKNEYDDITDLREQLKKAQETRIGSAKIKTMTADLRKRETILLAQLAAKGKYTERLSTTWRDVQNALADDDAAVEFCAYRNSTSLEYGAFVLRKGMAEPEYMPLFKTFDFASDAKKDEQQRQFCDVWKKMTTILKGAKRVFFSPVGDFHKYPIEYYAPSDMPQTLFYRVSSTRTLANPATRHDIRDATVYGGIDYDFGDVTTAPAGSKTRGAVVGLEGTLKEAGDICTALKSNGVHSSLLTGTAGTEESFKALSGSATNLIHIATHGFYWQDKELAANKGVAFLRTQPYEATSGSSESEMMTHSGLLFAGAYRALQHENLPANAEDGILTADEISALDLQSVDLAVLSACETGLGDISGEGVFGLQRGFKKAGVGSLIMSLWKVDDEATSLLMSAFYRYLFSGDTRNDKFRSLLKAQKYLREYNDGRFADPEYWSAFILLDGIN